MRLLAWLRRQFGGPATGTKPAPFRHRGRRERVWCEVCDRRVTLTPSGRVAKHRCQPVAGLPMAVPGDDDTLEGTA